MNPATTAPRVRSVSGRVEINTALCKGCELCLTACRENVLQLSEQINRKGYRYMIADNSKCTGCVNCALVCPDAVITVYRTRKKTAQTEVV